MLLQGHQEVSTREPSLFELIPDDGLSTTGILPDNIAFNVVMSVIDPNATIPPGLPDLDLPDPITGERDNVVYGTVVIYRDDTLDNTGSTDAESSPP